MTNKEKAILVATAAHGDQKYGIYPYIYHLKQVSEIAEALGFEEDIVTAAILHDSLEDTSISYNDLKKEFGEEVAEIVYAVTDELGRNRTERHLKTYPKIYNNWKATAVKICDRIVNINESLLSNDRMCKLYVKEHDNFVKGVKNPEHTYPELMAAWSMLDNLIKI